MDGGAWWAAVHGVAKSWTQLRDFTSTFHFHALEKEMATHSSVLAWRIPGTEEPGRRPSMGLHRVGHDWSNLAAAETCSRNLQWIDVFTKFQGFILFFENQIYVSVVSLCRRPVRPADMWCGGVMLWWIIAVPTKGRGFLGATLVKCHMNTAFLFMERSTTACLLLCL